MNSHPHQLGDKVRMTGTVAKHREGRRITWVPAPLPGSGRYGDTSVYDAGIIVGKRTLQEGAAAGGTWDEPAYFVRDHTKPPVTVYIVAFHLRRKPVLVLPTQISPLNQ